MAISARPPRCGVLLIAHGTVQDIDELPEFVKVIRRGAPPPQGLLEELRRRYEHIGGSPLLDMTRRQARALSEALGLPGFVAMRLWHPLLEEVLTDLAGLDRVCVIPMAPFSVHVYRAAAERVFRAHPEAPEAVYVEPWGQHPELVAAHARVIRESVPHPGETEIVLTAHSLPLAAVRADDPYAVQFEACARAVESAVGRKCRLAYQSQGAVGGEWLGPSIEQTLGELAEAGTRRVAIAPIGFLADHVETLYDLDVAAAAEARRLGLDFVRVPALNVDAGLTSALASLAAEALGL